MCGDAKQIAEYNIIWNPPNIEGMTSNTTTKESIVIKNLPSNTNFTINVAARGEIGGPDGEDSDDLKIATC